MYRHTCSKWSYRCRDGLSLSARRTVRIFPWVVHVVVNRGEISVCHVELAVAELIPDEMLVLPVLDVEDGMMIIWRRINASLPQDERRALNPKGEWSHGLKMKKPVPYTETGHGLKVG